MLEVLMSHNFLIYSLISILGLIIGSFLNVLIVRLPIILENEDQEYWNIMMSKNDSYPPNQQTQLNSINIAPTNTTYSSVKTFNLLWPRSHCPKCQTPIGIQDNIPIFSYCRLKGFCRFCHHPISLQYPVVELLTMLITVGIFYHFGMQSNLIIAWFFSWSLIALAVIDFNTQLLPDILTLPLLWAGLLVSTTHWQINSREAILAAAGGYTLFWILALIFKSIRKKEGMGHGDFKLLAAIGAWLGVISLINVIFIAVVLTLMVNFILLISKKIDYNQPLPFGPALAFAGWLVFLYGPLITNHLS